MIGGLKIQIYLITYLLEFQKQPNKMILSNRHKYIDSTHIKASANKKKYTKVNVKVGAKKYQDKLNDEDRKNHKKSHF